MCGYNAHERVHVNKDNNTINNKFSLYNKRNGFLDTKFGRNTSFVKFWNLLIKLLVVGKLERILVTIISTKKKL